MKRKFQLLTLLIFVVVTQAFTGKAKKAGYAFPSEMSAPIRTEYQKICDKGQALYQAACAGCHNVQVKGKWVIPDFTQDQVNGYEIRVGNGEHVRTLTDEAITTEELGFIATFLLYKEKSGGKVADAFGGKLSEDKHD